MAYECKATEALRPKTDFQSRVHDAMVRDGLHERWAALGIGEIASPKAYANRASKGALAVQVDNACRAMGMVRVTSDGYPAYFTYYLSEEHKACLQRNLVNE